MHMLSRKDQNSAELETARISESPSTVVTANGEVLTKEEATVYVKEMDLFVTIKAKITDIPTSGLVVRNHNSSKLADEHNEARRSSATPSSPTSVPQEALFLSLHPALRVRVAQHRGTRRMNQQKPKTQTEMETNETVRRNALHDLPEWSEYFTDNLVNESVPAHRDAPASFSRESASESRGRVASDKHSIYTHLPKDRNCDICMMRTKITSALCRRRTGEAVPRAEKFGDLITADYKVLNE